MNRIVPVLLALFAALVSQPAAAREVIYSVVDEAVHFDDDDLVELEVGGERFVAAEPAQIPAGVATFGPFRVLDATRAALVDVTDARSPAAFAAMIKAYPGIAVLRMVDCPGTEDDRANLRLGAMIRAYGVATHVPRGGFVASGAVEIFLAGTRRSAEPGAEFAVHSWADEDGREAKDYPADAPENRAYVEYYQRMGMTAPEAVAFYAMTNSVPFARAKRLTTADMGRWVRLERSELARPDAVLLAKAAAPTAPALGAKPGDSPGFAALALPLAAANALDSAPRLN